MGVTDSSAIFLTSGSGRDVGRVSIREFDAVLNFMVRHTYSMCTMGGRCNGYLVVEHNGDVSMRLLCRTRIEALETSWSTTSLRSENPPPISDSAT